MVKMANYLVVCLENPKMFYVNKALEWRAKGAANLIVSDYQMWQEIFGKSNAAPDSEPEKTRNTALQNKIEDNRDNACPSRDDALSAKERVPSQLKASTFVYQPSQRDSRISELQGSKR